MLCWSEYEAIDESLFSGFGVGRGGNFRSGGLAAMAERCTAFAYTPEALPAKLKAQWSREFSPHRQAWPLPPAAAG